MPLICLGVIHFVVLLAGFFSPYDFAKQDREAPYAPPARIHWVNGDGRFALASIYISLGSQTGEFQSYREDTQTPYPIHLLPQGVAIQNRRPPELGSALVRRGCSRRIYG